MPQEPLEPDERGFIFSDEDFSRRYCAEESASGAADPATPAVKPASPHSRGGSNAFMRARRRRAAAQFILTGK